MGRKMSDSEKESLINQVIKNKTDLISSLLKSGNVNSSSIARNVAPVNSKSKSSIPSISSIKYTVLLVFAILIAIIFFVMVCKKLYELYI